MVETPFLVTFKQRPPLAPPECILSLGWGASPPGPSPVILLHAGGQHTAAQLERGLGGLGLRAPAWGLARAVRLWPLVQLSLGREESRARKCLWSGEGSRLMAPSLHGDDSTPQLSWTQAGDPA